MTKSENKVKGNPTPWVVRTPISGYSASIYDADGVRILTINEFPALTLALRIVQAVNERENTEQ